MKTWRVAGINFDHVHMGDLLRMVCEHPHAEVVGLSDENPERMQGAIDTLEIPRERAYGDYRRCLEDSRPDLVILCPATAEHARWTELVAPYGPPIMMEKPFAASLADADAMIAAMRKTGQPLMINWPLRWYPPHVTAKRLIDEGRIGEVLEVHYYDGNSGPLRHGADKVETEPGRKADSWLYRKASGGGSLLDYLGYGTTLGTWYHNGRCPEEIVSMVDIPEGLEVDEHSVTVARYATGLSKFETRWGTFADPWKRQPQPKCGFVVVGSAGTVSSYDFEPMVRLQTLDQPDIHEVPVDVLEFPNHNPVAYMIDRLERGHPVDGPLSPEYCRVGQVMVDAAYRSAEEKRSVPLSEIEAPFSFK